MNDTKIQWADKSWNTFSGCQKVSAGCRSCYAETQALRYGAPAFPNGFDLTIRDHKLLEPLSLRKKSKIFVNSMSDVFWDKVPLETVDKLFGIILANHVLETWGFGKHVRPMERHDFLILTKRPERMVEYFAAGKDALLRRWAKACDHLFQVGDGDSLFSEYKAHTDVAWPLPGLWLGVTVENQLAASRVELLRQVPATIRFISFEPLLDGVTVDLSGIHWAIIGGESGKVSDKGARPFCLGAAEDLISQARKADVRVFVKQMGTIWAATQRVHGIRNAGRAGDNIDLWPKSLRFREFPEVAS